MNLQKKWIQKRISFPPTNSASSLKRKHSEGSESETKEMMSSLSGRNYKSGRVSPSSETEGSKPPKNIEEGSNNEDDSASQIKAGPHRVGMPGQLHRQSSNLSGDYAKIDSPNENSDEDGRISSGAGMPGQFNRQSSKLSGDYAKIDSPNENSDEDGRISSGSHEYEDYDQLTDMNLYSQDGPKESSWGCPFEELPQVPGCFKKTLPVLRNDSNHFIFFVTTPNLQEAKELPRPLSGEFNDNWDDNNEVKMPCSKGSQIPDPDTDTKKYGTSIINRWELIERTLKTEISDSFHLEEAILKYNQHYKHSWNFDALHCFFTNCGKDQRFSFFNMTLPKMAKLVLSLPRLFNKGIPFLKQNIDRKLTFSQQQVACLLANAFFCTFPRRNLRKMGLCPDINFSSMFMGPVTEQKIAKIKCIIHYFDRVTESMPKGVITYSRRVLRKTMDWPNSKDKLTKLHMSPRGTIEDEGQNMLQIDFANKYVGGGVLGHGCVQEEIRFLICPEMIVSRLFTEVLLDSEVLVMTGCERYSSYTGYSKTFRWDCDFVDKVERDVWGRRYTQVVAMDALSIKRSMNQFDKGLVKRELDKAYCAFQEVEREQKAAVCTGNWGCGAFGGDPELKGLIQIMAASKAKRDVCYLSVGNEKLCRDLSKIHEGCRKDNIAVGELYQVILDFAKKHTPRTPYSKVTLLDFIVKNFALTTDEHKYSSRV